jgi:hypothetical protein
MARAKWVALERWDTLDDRELKPLVAEAYRLIKEKLPRKTQAALEKAGAKHPPVAKGRTTAARRKKA